MDHPPPSAAADGGGWGYFYCSMSAKKSLGQHFLTSKKIVSDIILQAALSKTDTVLEIGPGKGILTEALLQNAGRVIVIEKDRELIPLLETKFKDEIGNDTLELICDDVLNLSLNMITKGDYKVVANIPYNITGELLRKLLSGTHQPTHMVLMVQKEVAERITCRDGKHSILSLSVAAYGTPNYVRTVPKKIFKPAPKVDSAILCVENISRAFFKDINEEKFFTLIKAGFLHKRKFLLRNVEPLFEEVHNVFTMCNIDAKARAETIPLQQWKCLYYKMNG